MPKVLPVFSAFASPFPPRYPEAGEKAGKPVVVHSSRYGRRQLFEPRQVESVMVLAADQVDESVRCLADGKIPPEFRTAGAHGESHPVGSFHFAWRPVVTDQTPCRPRLTLVEREC